MCMAACSLKIQQSTNMIFKGCMAFHSTLLELFSVIIIVCLCTCVYHSPALKSAPNRIVCASLPACYS